MQTMTPAQAAHQLTHVADRFEHWRQTRTTPAEPIPQYLWEQAIALTAMFPITRVATRLRVRALVQFDGNIFAFCNQHLCHLNVENFTHRQPPLQHAQSHSRNFAGGKVDTEKIVHHPIDM